MLTSLSIRSRNKREKQISLKILENKQHYLKVLLKRFCSKDSKFRTTLYSVIDKTVPKQSATWQLSFELSHCKVSSTDSKTITTLYRIINRPQEGTTWQLSFASLLYIVSSMNMNLQVIATLYNINNQYQMKFLLLDADNQRLAVLKCRTYLT